MLSRKLKKDLQIFLKDKQKNKKDRQKNKKVLQIFFRTKVELKSTVNNLQTNTNHPLPS